MTLEEAIQAARAAPGDTVFAIVSPRQAERLHLAMSIADSVVTAEECGHDTGIRDRAWKRYKELST